MRSFGNEAAIESGLRLSYLGTVGNLTKYLQSAFAGRCPAGWSCSPEVGLLPDEINKFLGYSSRADVLLEKNDGSRRLWIEFEISRADPVANHAKFATAHLFVNQLKTDAFIAMVSSHVTRGRRNLASNTIHLMRQIGMDAFQTLLLPQLDPREIKRLNHLDALLIGGENLPVENEIERIMSVAETLIETPDRRIHMVGDFPEVQLNIRKWNEEIENEPEKSLWNRRTITYFVFDPFSKNFAPSKFCAYSAIRHDPSEKISLLSEMTIGLYVTLDGTDSRFDGGRARMHLTDNLAMKPHPADDARNVLPFFEKWLNKHSESITLHPAGPVFLLPPVWFE
jgi:hypothetical protein